MTSQIIFIKLVFEIFFLEPYKTFSLSLVFQDLIVLVPCCSTIFNLRAWPLVRLFHIEILVFWILEIWASFLDNFIPSIFFVISFWELQFLRYQTYQTGLLIVSLLSSVIIFSLRFFFFLFFTLHSNEQYMQGLAPQHSLSLPSSVQQNGLILVVVIGAVFKYFLSCSFWAQGPLVVGEAVCSVLANML